MLTCNLFGETIYICNRVEFRALWKAEAFKRPRIWLEEEISAHLLADAESVRGMVASKRERPGKLLV